MIRQREAQERDWRRKEVEKERVKVAGEEAVRRTLAEQLVQKQDEAARAVQREKHFWEHAKQDWKQEMSVEKQQQEDLAKKRRDYLKDIKAQMEVQQKETSLARKKEYEGSKMADTERKQEQEKIKDIKERKLQQLRAYNVPEKYLREIEKKCQQAARSRFSLAYSGRK